MLIFIIQIRLFNICIGTITTQDLKGVYDVRRHPKYLNGEWTEDQILRKFLDAFDTKGSEDGVVS